MAQRHDLDDWVREAIRDNGGRATLLEVAKHIWRHHERDLLTSGDLFFTWQYDMRWAANRLRRKGIMKPASVSPAGIWEIAKSG